MSTADHDPAQPDATPLTALAERFLQLVTVIDRLRSPEGCPWDRKQTPQSMMPYLLEETYEVLESIESQDAQGLKEELGDLLLHIIFQGRMAQDANHFTQYCGQNLGRLFGNNTIVAKGFVLRAGFFQTQPVS